MGVLYHGRLKSRRYVRKELKRSVMGWEFQRDMYDRAQGCFHKKVTFYEQPYRHQVICGMWAYLSVNCVQAKHRGCGKTYIELI